jgi:hypothetical protein
MEMEDANQDLCVSPFCGDVIADKVNVTVYNDTEIDFDEFIWNIGGTIDTIKVLPLKQFTCWRNYDSLKTSYFYAIGVSGNQTYEMDSIWIDSNDMKSFRQGKVSLEIYRPSVNSNQLEYLFIENFNGDCRDF